ncbi:hypothetical protein TNCV_4240801 [Trichonephila clavipes]|nr:hypothetical protein TNCV_4240801 [Trichonephila clavipes]
MFKETGSFKGLPRSVKHVRQSFRRSPTKSTNEASLELQISPASLRQFLLPFSPQQNSVGGNFLVKVTDSWLACHEFEPRPAESPLHVKSVEAQMNSRWCCVEVSRGGCQFKGRHQIALV